MQVTPAKKQVWNFLEEKEFIHSKTKRRICRAIKRGNRQKAMKNAYKEAYSVL